MPKAAPRAERAKSGVAMLALMAVGASARSLSAHKPNGGSTTHAVLIPSTSTTTTGPYFLTNGNGVRPSRRAPGRLGAAPGALGTCFGSPSNYATPPLAWGAARACARAFPPLRGAGLARVPESTEFSHRPGRARAPQRIAAPPPRARRCAAPLRARRRPRAGPQ